MNTVIVIDPGHGGSNNGATYKGINEKYITMKTANAMYERLSKYDGVTVYMTHSTAEDTLSLAQRAEFAKSVNADYLISLHYNASEEHNLYGTEVWIPSIGTYYVKGYQVADKIIGEIANSGIYARGIKTKIGDDGDEYYGIIRECENRGIPSIIVEHCHLDNANDDKYWENDEKIAEFGRADADGVAKFLKLKSSILGVDYSMEENVSVSAPSQRIYQDTTPPRINSVDIAEYSNANRRLEFTISAADDETGINYYSYSLDGGTTFSNLLIWSGGNSMNVVVDNVSQSSINLVVKVYNKYDLSTQSQAYKVVAKEEQTTQEQTTTVQATTTYVPETTTQAFEEETTTTYHIQETTTLVNSKSKSFTENNKNAADGVFVIIVIALAVATVVYVVKRKKNKKKRRRR